MNTTSSTLADVIVLINRAALPDKSSKGLTSIRVSQGLSTPAQAELIFNAYLGFTLEDMFPAFKDSIEIIFMNTSKALFHGEVTAIEYSYLPDGNRQLHIRAYDELYPLFKRQRDRIHVKTDIQRVVKEWASDLNLTLESHIDESPPQWDWRLQRGETDGAWLMSTSHEQGYYFHSHNHKLNLLKLSGSNCPKITLELGKNLREGVQSSNAHYDCDSTKVSGWDPVESRVVNGRAGRETGLSRIITNHNVNTPKQADCAASALFDKCLTSKNRFWGVAEGDPDIYPGKRIQLKGFPETSQEIYVLSSVIHKIDASSGYISEMDTLPPTPPPKKEATSPSMLAIVSNIDDPRKSGRVKVSLPTCGDLETDWLPVMQIASGENKGLLCIPSCGDQVVFFPLANDPAQAVVLAGLYGAKPLPDDAVKGDLVNRYSFCTPSGHYLRFDESAEKLTLHHKNGSYLSFMQKETRLHSSADFFLSASGKRIVIRGKKVDFEQE